MNNRPVLEWLEETFEASLLNRTGGATVEREMIQLIPLTKSGEPQRVCAGDYTDAMRWWL
jgi:hypothetical protein